MDLPKPSAEDKARFRELVAETRGVEVRPMFGSVGAFVNGNMFAGLFGTSLGVKLDTEALARAQALPGSGPFGPAQRPMGGWIALPRDLDESAVLAWFDTAREHVATLPPKTRVPRKRTR
ncbi:MAG: TfoX/Sxy family protein [Dermatophilaceae bacterium]